MLMRLKSRLKSHLRKFRRDEDGTVIAEAVIMFPTLFCAVLATYVFFDAFRNQAVNVKANYTIADAVSRETNYITNTFMNNTWNLHRFLTDSPTRTRLRISVISYDADENEHTVVWSRTKGGGDAFDDSAITTIGLTAAEIPVMPNNEILIVVQTDVIYQPMFTIGLESFVFRNTSYTRPRFAPDNVCYSANNKDDERICPIGS